MASQGKIGDDVKPEKTLNKLNSIISEARTHALQENYDARVKAKTLAMEENYDEYDVQKGRVIHKIYGKQVGGSETLKASPASAPATLKASPAAQLPQLAQPQIAGGMMMMQPQPPRQAINNIVRSELSSASQARVQRQVVQQARAPAVAATRPYKVQVPAGLSAGQPFIAQVGAGQMLVTTPAGVSGGQWVMINVPSHMLKATPRAVPKVALASRTSASTSTMASEHPFAASMIAASIADHYASTPHDVYGLSH